MVVGGKLAEIERDRFAAECFTQIDGTQACSLAIIHADAALEIRQGEGGLPVAAVGRAEDGEEGDVLGDGEELAVGESPAAGGEVAGEEIDLAEQGLVAGCAAAAVRGEDALESDDGMEREGGL